MPRSPHYIPAALLLIFLPTNAPAQPPDDQPLITDRPDFTESPYSIPPGRAQLEMGVTFTRADSDTDSLEGPEALLRIGLLDRLELRLGFPNVAWMDDSRDDDAGFTDLSLGAKLELTAHDGLTPDSALIFTLSLPTGDDDFTEDSAVPELRWAGSWSLPDDWSLSTNLGCSVPEDDSGDAYAELLASVALGVPLADRLGAFAEYYGLYPAGAGLGPEHYVNGGLTWLLTSNLQLDIRAGAGLNSRSDDFFTGAGLSIRF